MEKKNKNYTTQYKGQFIIDVKDYLKYPNCNFIKLAGEILDEQGFVKYFIDEDGNERSTENFHLMDIEDDLNIKESKQSGFSVQDLIDFCIKNGKDLNNTFIKYTDIDQGGVCNCTILQTNEEVNIVEIL